MKQFRLYRLATAALETYEIGHAPPYIAVSHAWSDQIFSTGVESSFGGAAVRKIVAELLPTVSHCWIDNFCIKQDDEADKLEQIPLMGDIYHRAEAVAIVLTCNFGLTQLQVDRATVALREALEAWRDEAWTEEEFLQQWAYGPRRETLVQAMKGLAKFTKSAWGTRIWTLQEYVLAKSVVWIGSDLNPVTIDDGFFQAVPGLCDQLGITECMSRSPESEFAILHTHFSGMASQRLGDGERTRIMELLGNRNATVPVDEVYGVMAASGVEIAPVPGESRERAWERWWEAAVCRGQVRWAVLPPAPLVDEANVPGKTISNCIVPAFLHRHDVSAASYLDSVAPLDTVTVVDGTLTLSGRFVGNCTLLRELGSVHESRNRYLHKDITLTLFARGRWSVALQIVEAFGPGRYYKKQQVALAHILVDNYSKALRYVRKQREMDFNPYMRSGFHYSVWGGFMQLQARCIMDGLNDGIRFLACIRYPSLGVCFTTVVIVGDYLPTGPLVALDFNALTGDQRYILLIAELPLGSNICSTRSDATRTTASLHKVGTTIPVTAEHRRLWETLPTEQFSLGGSRCHVCTASPQKTLVKKKEKRGCPIYQTRMTVLPERVGIRLHRVQLDRVERTDNIRRKLNLAALNRSRRRLLRLRRLTNP
ncbi:HET domain protein [Zopfia rhizophila CBS 207.26]|uniref:HET domain protein n=1 Tax=Zopfia rhizophila CBS 207.26 TaxID=1314779 RepID=A0A6A6E6B5_9PEZI|nr:HET domain protein [Zopfia rhizophila CBS 207.26]